MAWLCGGLAVGVAAPPDAPPNNPAQPSTPAGDDSLPAPRPVREKPPLLPEAEYKRRAAEVEATLPQPPPSVLTSPVNAVDLACVLRLTGVENPEILIARQQVIAAVAERQLAAAQILPNLNVGLNFDNHVGTLQQSSGNILKVNRGAFYLGLGANAVAAGSVNIPGLLYNVNLSQALFSWLAARQEVRVREFNSQAVRNDVLLRVASAYVELLRAEGRRAITIQNREEAHEIARVTAVYARYGEARQADADRAATEYARRIDDVVQAEGELLTASAALAQLLNIPPAVQLHAIDGWVVPAQVVPDPIPLNQLLFIAINQRPELASRRAAIREAILILREAQLLPFSPNIIAGYSAGTFGGGSNLIAQPGGFAGLTGPRFDNFAPRDDLDVILFWTAQNMGVGNLAQVRLRRSEQRSRELEWLLELNRVRSEVATAYAQTHARFAQLGIAERAVKSGQLGFEEDRRTTYTGGPRVVLPIELLNSFRLLARARLDYLDAISDYNRAQFALYVALGQPPARYLARPVPVDLVPPPAPAPRLPCCTPADSAGLPLMPPAANGSENTAAAPQNAPGQATTPARERGQ